MLSEKKLEMITLKGVFWTLPSVVCFSKSKLFEKLLLFSKKFKTTGLTISISRFESDKECDKDRKIIESFLAKFGPGKTDRVFWTRPSRLIKVPSFSENAVLGKMRLPLCKEGSEKGDWTTINESEFLKFTNKLER